MERKAMNSGWRGPTLISSQLLRMLQRPVHLLGMHESFLAWEISKIMQKASLAIICFSDFCYLPFYYLLKRICAIPLIWNIPLHTNSAIVHLSVKHLKSANKAYFQSS